MIPAEKAQKKMKLTIQGITKIISGNVASIDGQTWFIRRINESDASYDFVVTNITTEHCIRLLRNLNEGISLSGWNWERSDGQNSYVTVGFIQDPKNMLFALGRELLHRIL
jgi:hypothetical protein